MNTRILLFRILTFLFAVAVPAAQAAERRPDIVVFLTDDHSQLDSTPYGSRDLRTPHMQRLADEGLTFTNAFVASPSCAPSRASLLTGLMPARTGAQCNHDRPRPDVKKWPAFFHDLGYEVVAFGKVSHYRHTADYGFDHFAHDTFHDHDSIPAAVDYLKRRGESTSRPLCLMVGSNWPHVPWPKDPHGYKPEAVELPAGSVDTTRTREWRARYSAAVTMADDDFGSVYDTARAVLGDDSIFLFSGDHGTQWPFGKWNCYDAGIKVPLIVRWKGVVRPGTRTDAMVSWIDFLPTLLEAAGGKAPAELDGRSFLPVLRGKGGEHRDRIFTTHNGDGHWNIYPIRSVRTADWKYIRNLHPEFAFTTHIDLAGDLGQRDYWSTWERAAKKDPAAAVIVKRYHARPAEELYDLAADPHEQRNLAADPAHAARLKSMREEVDAWMREQGDRVPLSGKPRLLSDPASYGPDAPSGDDWATSATGKN